MAVFVECNVGRKIDGMNWDSMLCGMFVKRSSRGRVMASIKQTPWSILKQPLVTEKTAIIGAKGNAGTTVVFEVHTRANKIEIKRAVEKIFNVKVAQVRTMNCLGKVKQVRSKAGQQSATKKAYITLAPGDSIPIVEGL